MMVGVITSKQLLKHSFLIINEYGIKVYTICVYRLIKGDTFTFLEIACTCEGSKKDNGNTHS